MVVGVDQVRVDGERGLDIAVAMFHDHTEEPWLRHGSGYEPH
jgi:hypothetical protein